MLRFLLRSSFVVALLMLIGYGAARIQQDAGTTEWFNYFNDGTVLREYTVDSDGRFHGEMIEYWPGGALCKVSHWEHGIEVGASEHYDSDGIPID